MLTSDLKLFHSDFSSCKNDDDNQDGLFAETYLRIDIDCTPGPVERNGKVITGFNQVSEPYINEWNDLRDI